MEMVLNGYKTLCFSHFYHISVTSQPFLKMIFLIPVNTGWALSFTDKRNLIHTLRKSFCSIPLKLLDYKS